MQPTERAVLRLVVVGHVDHGKSTLIGRLFHDLQLLPEGKLEAIRAMCERRGMPFEWAFLMDALQAERDQGITIDTAQTWLRAKDRDYVVIDAPGHREFLKNMVTGAASAEAALLLIDAQEGVRDQTRRHGYLLKLLGIEQVLVLVNKLDAIGYRHERVAAIEAEFRGYAASIGLPLAGFLPISAREGDNIASRSAQTLWYEGPTLVEALAKLRPMARAVDLPLRLPIQDVYKFDERRIFAGRIESGILRVGDTLVFSPSNKSARVASIEAWACDVPPVEGRAGQSVGLTFAEPIFVERGEVASHEAEPPVETDVFRARLFWLGRNPLRRGGRYKLKLNHQAVPVSVQAIERVIDTTDLSDQASEQVERNAVAEVVLRADSMLALDPHGRLTRTGRFVLVDGYDIAGGGIISMQGYADQRHLMVRRATNLTRVEHEVSLAARELRNGHRGGVLWLTGLSASGKSTLAVAVERRLFNLSYHAYVLDGDNIRGGLCADLGFSPEERAENIRRVGEVAALMSRAGTLVLTAFISPYRSDRDRARKAAGERFHEVYVKADLATCEARDPKGLYKRARAGQIRDFTGVSAPYEPPERPELTIDTGSLTIEQSVQRIVDHVQRHFAEGAAFAGG
ncbi:MAG: adenylyl-sulfate kinase [Alphaproteobacteria bacterium]|nr:adenylyl-sulfate kinase [Alphaproteobacteria bacterium]